MDTFSFCEKGICIEYFKEKTGDSVHTPKKRVRAIFSSDDCVSVIFLRHGPIGEFFVVVLAARRFVVTEFTRKNIYIYFWHIHITPESELFGLLLAFHIGQTPLPLFPKCHDYWAQTDP